MRKRNTALITCAVIMAIFSVGCGRAQQDNIADEETTAIVETEESSEEPTFFVHPREASEYQIAADYPFEWDHGSCKNIGEKTVIVSIFLTDKVYGWDEENEVDVKLMQKQLDRMTSATEWITKVTADYDVTPEFVFDWNENDDLKYMVSSQEDICNTENEKSIWKIIEKEIETDKLLDKYDASNILYMVMQNVPKNWDLSSLTWIYEGDEYPYEFTLMYPYAKGSVVGAASYAHEILHAFGAHDLYIADEGETYVVTEEYLEHLKNTGSRDIMFTVSDTSGGQGGNGISGVFTELDAYYVGIGEEPSEVEEYGLDKSEYQ